MNASRRTSDPVRTFFALLRKELVQLFRDRAIFLFICYIFTLDIVIQATGSSVELRRETVLVRDSDDSALSRELRARLRPPYFRTLGAAADRRNDERALERGDARLVLELPRGLAERVTAARERVQVPALVDSSKVLSGYLASSYTARITEALNEELASERLARFGIDPARLPRVENEVRVAYNFAGDDRWTTAISKLFTMMTFACALLPAAAMVREKEHGTLEQLLVSPLTPLEILTPKVVSMVLVSVVGAAVAVLCVLGWGLDVPCRGSLPLFLLLTAVYAFTNAGLGVLVGTFARTTAQVGLILLLILMPIVQLSGTWTAIESTPAWLQHAIQLSPLYHYIEIGKGILFKGVGLEVLWLHALVMLALGLVLSGLALSGFRRFVEGAH